MLSVVAADDVGRVIHPVLCEGQVEGGTLQAVGYATIEEIKLLDGRYLNDRLQTYLIPTSLDAPRHRDDPRGGPVRGRAARRQGRRASCRWTSGRPRSWPRSTTRPGPGSTTCPRRRSGSWPRSPASSRPGRPGVSAVSPAAAPGGRRVTRQLIVNGGPVEIDAPGMRRLLDVLREDLGLTGTKEGCGEGECGACTVLVDGDAGPELPRPGVPARWRRRPHGGGPGPGGRAAGHPPGGVPRDRRRPVRDLHPGHAHGRRGVPRAPVASRPTTAIREAIAGNLCRCTGYTKIVDAIRLAAERGGPGRPVRPAPVPAGRPDAGRAAGRLAALAPRGLRAARRASRTVPSPAGRTCSSS